MSWLLPRSSSDHSRDPIFTHTLCVAAQRIGCSSTSALVGTIGTTNVRLEGAHHGVLLEEAIP